MPRRSAAFFSKAKFGPLQVAGTLDYSQAPGGWFGRWSSQRTVTDVATHLESAKPNVLFVHLTDPDAAGHSNGWMTDAYGRAVLEADRAVNRLISLADHAVKQGELAESSVRTMDTAATVLWLLAVDEPVDWAGRAVAEAFTAPSEGPFVAARQRN